jgi:hypothetical protein
MENQDQDPILEASAVSLVLVVLVNQQQLRPVQLLVMQESAVEPAVAEVHPEVELTAAAFRLLVELAVTAVLQLVELALTAFQQLVVRAVTVQLLVHHVVAAVSPLIVVLVFK